jgi:hypothetical protein
MIKTSHLEYINIIFHELSENNIAENFQVQFSLGMTDLPNDQNDMPYSTINNGGHSIIVDRPIITQKSFDKVFIPTAYEDRTPVILLRQIRSYIRSKCMPSEQCGKSYLKILFPFLSWLKIYQLTWLPNDVICGVTV